jgi:hypothetical protein
MKIKESVIESRIKHYFKEDLNLFKSNENNAIVISHCGVFSQDLVNSLVDGNEELMRSSGDKKVLIKRVFSILIEGLQNIRIHGKEDELNNKIGFLIVSKDISRYKIVFGNLVNSNAIQSISSQIDDLNHLNSEGVKFLYNKVLTEGVFSEKGGAGLGFITLKMKSNNELKYRFSPINSLLSFFSIEVTINRLD